MDIGRMPVAPLARPAANYNPPPRATAVDVAGPLESPRSTSRRGEGFERAVQGELLRRERPASSYQSTRAFIEERAFEQAAPGPRDTGGAHTARLAVSRYLYNTRPESAVELTQGRSVNFFV